MKRENMKEKVSNQLGSNYFGMVPHELTISEQKRNNAPLNHQGPAVKKEQVLMARSNLYAYERTSFYRIR